jgi:endogenous inhibitor of DNA gyrase (YacG/DUF329 family)
MKHKCPTCKKTVEASLEKESDEANFFPFCSQRCRLIDLGAWLDDKYRIFSKPSDTPQDTSADTQ